MHSFLANARDMVGIVFRWAITPSHDPISRFCSTLALGAVALLLVTVAYVEISR